MKYHPKGTIGHSGVVHIAWYFDCKACGKKYLDTKIWQSPFGNEVRAGEYIFTAVQINEILEIPPPPDSPFIRRLMPGEKVPSE